MTHSTRTPTGNIEAEMALLGAMLLGGANMVEVVAERMSGADFYREAHGRIFDAMATITRRCQILDIVTLKDELLRCHSLEAVGGLPYLMVLGDFVPVATESGVRHYAQIVQADSTRRQLYVAAQEIAALAASEADAGELTERAEALILDATKARRGPESYRTMQTVVESMLSRVEDRIRRGGTMAGIPTGLSKWDRMTGGLCPGQLHIVAARSGMGKSVFGSTVAVNVAAQGLSVAVFSSEMMAEDIADRMAAAATSCNATRIRRGQFSPAEFGALCQAVADTIALLPIAFDDTPAISTSQILSKCRQIRRERGLDLVVVDYLQRLTPDTTRKGGTRAEEVSQIAMDLKTMAGTLGVPVVALAQPNRAVDHREDKRPKLSDLADSSGIEKEADTVSMIYRPGFYQRAEEGESSAPEFEEAEILVEKNRGGERGTARVLFSGPYQRFDNLADEEGGF